MVRAMAQAKVSRSPWARFGKWLNILVLGAFFLPFFGVSCDGIDVVTVSGADMAFGCMPGGALAEAQKEAEKRDMGDMPGSSDKMKLAKVDIEPLAIVALVLVIGGVVLSFRPGKKMVQASLVAAVLALGATVGLWAMVGGKVDDEIGKTMKDDMGKSSMTRDSKIESGSRMGLWIALLGLAGAAALAAVSLKHREETLEVVPPAPEGPGTGPLI
jgi:hypothetical protein